MRDHRCAGCFRSPSAHGRGRIELGPGRGTGQGSFDAPTAVSSMPCQRALFLPQQLRVNPLPPLLFCAVDSLSPASPALCPVVVHGTATLASPMAAGHRGGSLLGLALSLPLLPLVRFQWPKPEWHLRAGLLATAIGDSIASSCSYPCGLFPIQGSIPVASAIVATTCLKLVARLRASPHDRAGHLLATLARCCSRTFP